MSRQTAHTIIALLFVISGAVGLVYQIVWFKYLSLFLGNTTYAQTIVLATFMGGLAIGSAWWGRRADVAARPLRLYAWLELGIGAYCLLYPLIMASVQRGFVYVATSLQLASGSEAVLILKLLVSLLTLLLPTILMGGTLPILVRFVSRRIEESGQNVAILYFLNSFGAVMGSILGGFFFVRILGLNVTIGAGAVVSILIGISALLLGRFRFEETQTEPTPAAENAGTFTDREVFVAILVAGCSGMASMIFEVTWVRLLIPVLGSSTYSFSLMLVGFISGITLGSLIVSRLLRIVRRLFRLLAWCQLGIVVAMLIMIPLYARIPYAFWKMAHVLVRTDSTYPIFLSMQFIFGLMIMIVPTVFLGMSLPVATRIAARGLHVLGRSVGNVFAVNTFGTVLGSLGAGLVLIPLIGVKHTMEFGIVLNAAAGIGVFWADITASVRRRILVTIGVVGAFGVYWYAVPDWSRGAMLTGVFRQVNANAEPPSSYSEFAAAAGRTPVLFYREGTMATVGVVRGQTPEGSQRVLIINGKADASDRGDLPTQVLLGQLPMLLHPKPASALVIGLGSGITVGSVLKHPVERVDCVEISPEVVEASSWFEEASGTPLKDPRMSLHVEDALAYLNLTSRRYDVIISEPSNPWIAGIGNLYTTDFFAACKERMNPGGLMVQWFHMYEMDDELFRLVLRTFRSSFRWVSVWQSMSPDVILIGSEQPLDLNESRLRLIMDRPAVRDDLKRIELDDAFTLLSLKMLSDGTVVRYAGAGPLNTEDNSRLEYEAPRAFFVNRGVTSILRVDERLAFGGTTSLLAERRIAGTVTDENLRRIGMLHTAYQRGNLLLGYSVLRNYDERHPDDPDVLRRLLDVSEQMKRGDDAMGYLRRLLAKFPDDPELLERLTWAEFADERTHSNALTGLQIGPYEQPLRRCVALVNDTVDRYRVRLADLFFAIQSYAKASDQYMRALQIRERYTPDPRINDDVLLLQLARCQFFAGKRDRALGYALQAVNRNRKNKEAVDFMYDIWTGALSPADSTRK